MMNRDQYYTIRGDDKQGYTITRNEDAGRISGLSRYEVFTLRASLTLNPELTDEQPWRFLTA
jgi:hypothetical protein